MGVYNTRLCCCYSWLRHVPSSTGTLTTESTGGTKASFTCVALVAPSTLHIAGYARSKTGLKYLPEFLFCLLRACMFNCFRKSTRARISRYLKFSHLTLRRLKFKTRVQESVHGSSSDDFVRVVLFSFPFRTRISLHTPESPPYTRISLTACEQAPFNEE